MTITEAEIQKFLREQHFDDKSVDMVRSDMVDARFGQGTWEQHLSNTVGVLYAIHNKAGWWFRGETVGWTRALDAAKVWQDIAVARAAFTKIASDPAWDWPYLVKFALSKPKTLDESKRLEAALKKRERRAAMLALVK